MASFGFVCCCFFVFVFLPRIKNNNSERGKPLFPFLVSHSYYSLFLLRFIPCDCKGKRSPCLKKIGKITPRLTDKTEYTKVILPRLPHTLSSPVLNSAMSFHLNVLICRSKTRVFVWMKQTIAGIVGTLRLCPTYQISKISRMLSL